MGFFSFLKYTFITFVAHLATSCGAPCENHWFNVLDSYESCHKLEFWNCTSFKPAIAVFNRLYYYYCLFWKQSRSSTTDII
jgi:hypothetical protein